MSKRKSNKTSLTTCVAQESESPARTVQSVVVESSRDPQLPVEPTRTESGLVSSDSSAVSQYTPVAWDPNDPNAPALVGDKYVFDITGDSGKPSKPSPKKHSKRASKSVKPAKHVESVVEPAIEITAEVAAEVASKPVHVPALVPEARPGFRNLPMFDLSMGLNSDPPFFVEVPDREMLNEELIAIAGQQWQARPKITPVELLPAAVSATVVRPEPVLATGAIQLDTARKAGPTSSTAVHDDSKQVQKSVSSAEAMEVDSDDGVSVMASIDESSSSPLPAESVPHVHLAEVDDDEVLTAISVERRPAPARVSHSMGFHTFQAQFTHRMPIQHKSVTFCSLIVLAQREFFETLLPVCMHYRGRRQTAAWWRALAVHAISHGQTEQFRGVSDLVIQPLGYLRSIMPAEKEPIFCEAAAIHLATGRMEALFKHDLKIPRVRNALTQFIIRVCELSEYDISVITVACQILDQFVTVRMTRPYEAGPEGLQHSLTEPGPFGYAVAACALRMALGVVGSATNEDLALFDRTRLSKLASSHDRQYSVAELNVIQSEMMVELGGTLPLAGQPIDWVHAMLRWIPIAELMPQLEMPIDGQRLVLMAERFIKEMLLDLGFFCQPPLLIAMVAYANALSHYADEIQLRRLTGSSDLLRACGTPAFCSAGPREPPAGFVRTPPPTDLLFNSLVVAVEIARLDGKLDTVRGSHGQMLRPPTWIPPFDRSLLVSLTELAGTRLLHQSIPVYHDARESLVHFNVLPRYEREERLQNRHATCSQCSCLNCSLTESHQSAFSAAATAMIHQNHTVVGEASNVPHVPEQGQPIDLAPHIDRTLIPLNPAGIMPPLPHWERQALARAPSPMHDFQVERFYEARTHVVLGPLPLGPQGRPDREAVLDFDFNAVEGDMTPDKEIDMHSFLVFDDDYDELMLDM